jgi:hypothetical protein
MTAMIKIPVKNAKRATTCFLYMKILKRGGKEKLE